MVMTICLPFIDGPSFLNVLEVSIPTLNMGRYFNAAIQITRFQQDNQITKIIHKCSEKICNLNISESPNLVKKTSETPG